LEDADDLMAKAIDLSVVAKSLGKEFAYVAKKKAIVHAPTASELVLIPGGVLTMGFTIDDVLAITLVIEDMGEWRRGEVPFEIERARPPHVRVVPPFLAARKLASEDDLTAKAALAAAKKAGLRLLSEAEWEWIAREGGAVQFTSVPAKDHPVVAANWGMTTEGPNGFGIDELTHGPEWVADAWHPNYVRAPANARPWGKMPGTYRVGHTQWQDMIEVVSLHAATRGQGKQARFRYACDLPGTPPKSKKARFDVAGSMKEMLHAVATEPKLAVEALAFLLSVTVYDDTRALLAALAKRWPKLPESTRALIGGQISGHASGNPTLKKALDFASGGGHTRVF
jgi:hypothetical protein